MCWLVHKRTVPLKAGPVSFKRLLGASSSKSKESKQGIKALELSRVNILRLHRPQDGVDEQRHRSGHAPQNEEREPPGGIVTAPDQKGKHGGCNDRGAHKRSESVQIGRASCRERG